MIFNKHLDRLTEVDIVQDFMKQHNMRGKACCRGDDDSFLLYRNPYVIEFRDNLIENYLEIYVSDLNENLIFKEGSAIEVSVDLGYQNNEELRKRNFNGHPKNEVFLSDGARKMYDLQVGIEAIGKLLPLLEAKGGLAALRDGTFDVSFDFADSVRPMWHGLREGYLACINGGGAAS